MEVRRLMVHSLQYFNPHISFYNCIKSPHSNQNEYENMSW
ncbi:hypothetical protein E2C01_010009 [Portunus trituberculatus]|uniref:Uncharacterized protein n=1 Tax=Portunus trituberculatus TaxID=210409 RepID=A0A5B7D784_PORTR|nr:hypothetical protein [Portunus trituberculatus]